MNSVGIRKMNKVDWFNILIGIVIGTILTSIATKQDKDIIVQEKIVRDTITKYQKPIIIEKIKAQIVYKHDTIIQTKPFIARIDTVIMYDTIKASYEFPENYFSLLVKRKPDTVYTNTIYRTEYQEIKRPLYIDILSHTGAILSGFLIGNNIK